MIYIIFALLGLMVYQDYMNRKERDRLIEAFMAKNLREFKHKPSKEPTQPAAPEDMLVEDVDDEAFDKAIKVELGKEPIIEKMKRKVKRGR